MNKHNTNEKASQALTYMAAVKNLEKLGKKRRESERVAQLIPDWMTHKIRQCTCGRHVSIGEQTGAVIAADWCRERLCPMCDYRRSLRLYRDIARTLAEMEEQRPFRYLMMTVTVKNVDGQALRDTIRHILTSWHRMVKTKDMAACLGFIRTLEVTHKRSTYHPHIHAIIAVDPAYFDNREGWISQAKLTRMWRAAARLDYDPVVDIRTIYAHEQTDHKEIAELVEVTQAAQRKAVAEVAKYAVKSTSIRDTDTYETLRLALHGIRMYATGGIIKTTAAALHALVAEGDLDLMDDYAGQTERIIDYVWKKSGYQKRQPTDQIDRATQVVLQYAAALDSLMALVAEHKAYGG